MFSYGERAAELRVENASYTVTIYFLVYTLYIFMYFCIYSASKWGETWKTRHYTTSVLFCVGGFGYTSFSRFFVGKTTQYIFIDRKVADKRKKEVFGTGWETFEEKFGETVEHNDFWGVLWKFYGLLNCFAGLSFCQYFWGFIETIFSGLCWNLAKFTRRIQSSANNFFDVEIKIHDISDISVIQNDVNFN